LLCKTHADLLKEEECITKPGNKFSRFIIEMDTEENRSVQDLPKVADYLMRARSLVKKYPALGLNTLNFETVWNLLLDNAEAFDSVLNSIKRIESGEPEYDFLDDDLNDLFEGKPIEGDILETMKMLREDFGL